VIDTQAQAVRLEVGVTLEAVYVDAFVSYIERDQMISFFRKQRTADGILAATEMIVTRAQNADANNSYQDEVWYAGSAGAGATTMIQSAPQRTTSRQQITAGITPQQTLSAYADAMAQVWKEPALMAANRSSVSTATVSVGAGVTNVPSPSWPSAFCPKQSA